MSNAGAQINNISATNDFASGLNFITNTSKLSKNIDKNSELDLYIELLNSIKNKINPIPSYSFTASSLDMEQSKINFEFDNKNNSFNIQNYFDIQQESVGWITGAQVTYCAEAFATVDFFHKDSPALSVLGAVLRNGYLHSAIREKGGAYGSGAMQDSNNKVFKFFSYRDPRCVETFNDFQKSREWSLKNITQEQLDEGILGIISSIDKPLSPYGEAMSDFSMNLDKKDLERRLEIRSLVKSCTLDDLINVSQKYLFNESKRSVIAGENYIEELKKLNFEIRNI
jgi:Zn-dependent M16 (insulinase) family peptidase